MFRGVAGAARHLLDLPNGLHFARIQLQWLRWGDICYVAELVTACSGTLKFLDLSCTPEGVAYLCWTSHLL